MAVATLLSGDTIIGDEKRPTHQYSLTKVRAVEQCNCLRKVHYFFFRLGYRAASLWGRARRREVGGWGGRRGGWVCGFVVGGAGRRGRGGVDHVQRVKASKRLT